MILLLAASAWACGPFFGTSVLCAERTPDPDVPDLVAGRIGIVLPSWEVPYRIVAFRWLAGVPLDADEQAQATLGLREPWRDTVELRDAVEAWQHARGPGGAPIDPTRPATDEDGWINCTASAFRTATATLAARRKAWGADSPWVADWIAAQDDVFQHCGSVGGASPPPAPAGAPVTLVQDRAYQAAAARFYDGDYATAYAAFTLIAADKDSPWQPWGAYLAVRAAVRDHSVGTGSLDLDAALALLDRSPQAGPARDLGLRLHAGDGDFRGNLARDLLRPHRLRGAMLRDFARSVEDRDEGPVGDVSDAELDQWLFGDAAGVDRWPKAHRSAWLVAALEHALGEAAGVPTPSAPPAKVPDALLRAAAEVPATDPAWATLTWLRARAVPDEAGPLYTALLASDLPRGSHNLVATGHLPFAASLHALLEDGIQTPIGFSVEGGWDTDVKLRPTVVAADRLVLGVPETRWGEVLADPAVAPVHDAVVVAAFVRAALLGADDDLVARTSGLAAVHPKLDLTPVTGAADAEARQFGAVLVVLRNPGLNLYPVPPYSREDALDPIDSYHDNWWGEVAAPPPPAFLTASERKAAADEAEVLRVGASTSMGRVVLAYAKAHPDAPDVPEALHRLVKATRYGSPDSAVSKAAFTLLHKRYGSTAWAEKTPYWF